MEKLTAMFLITISVACVSGCKAIECGEYRDVLHDAQRSDELLHWADKEIFSRTFANDDFRVAGTIGPGRNGANFSLERAKINLPAWLDGYVVRAIGPDKFHPDLIFIGRRRYQGFIVGRNELPTSVKETPVDISKLEEWKGRLGLMCYVD